MEIQPLELIETPPEMLDKYDKYLKQCGGLSCIDHTDYVLESLCDMYMQIVTMQQDLMVLLQYAHGDEKLQQEIIKLMDRLK